MKEIYTEHLVLRPTCVADAEDIQGYFDDWEIIKWLRPPVPWPYPEAGALFYVTELADKPLYHSFAIRLKESEQVIGTIRMEEIVHDGQKMAERGYCLDRRYWGKGLMSEAAGAINEWAFATLDVVAILSYNAVGNEASHRIKQKQGFVFDGVHETVPAYHNGCNQEERWLLWCEGRK